MLVVAAVVRINEIDQTLPNYVQGSGSPDLLFMELSIVLDVSQGLSPHC